MTDKKNDDARVNQMLEDGSQAFFRALAPSPHTNLHRDNSTGSQVSVSSTSTATSNVSKSNHTDSDGDGPKLPLMKMEGFLMKKSSGARKQWSRRYFILNLQECRLDYVSTKDTDSQTVAAYLNEARITDAEHDDRRFVLHISSPSVSYHLQAETEGDYNDWKSALLAAYQHGPQGTNEISQSRLKYSVSVSSSSSSLNTMSFRSPSKSLFDNDDVKPFFFFFFPDNFLIFLKKILIVQISGDSGTLLKSGELYFRKGW